jgi:hypothetical protein
MSRKVALVGHCGPDSSYLRMTVAKAGRDIQVLSADDDAQQAALQAGALPGFGKRELGSPKIPEMIRAALAEEPSRAG